MNLFEELDTLDPSSKLVPSRIETPTPHKIAVLMLLKQYLRDKKSSMETGITMRSQRRRMFFMLIFNLVQEPDMTYNELHNMLTSRPFKLDTLLLEGFEKSMSEFCGSAGIEALFDFADLQNINTLLNEEYGVNQFSMVGVYVRRIGVVLERFTFAEMMSMYRNICVYYERGMRALSIGSRKLIAGGVLRRSVTPPPLAAAAISTGEGVTESNEEPLGPHNSLSRWAPRQAKHFINSQSELLEHDDAAALPPKQLQRHVQQIIEDLPLNTTSYFLGYMNQLRIRDYYNALSALHRATDRSPVRLMMGHEKGYQYFCINLGVMHATFGHRDEALAALRESIMLAQEHGDRRSLNLANTWYCLLRDELPLSYVQRSVAEISEGDSNQLQNYTLALHFAVKLGTVAGYQPLRLFDLLQHSDHLTNRNNLASHAAEALALRSAVWCAYGRHELAALYAQLLLLGGAGGGVAARGGAVGGRPAVVGAVTGGGAGRGGGGVTDGGGGGGVVYGGAGRGIAGGARVLETGGGAGRGGALGAAVAGTEGIGAGGLGGVGEGYAGTGSALASFAMWLHLQGEMRLARVLLHRAREHLPRLPSAECWMISQCHLTIQSGIYRCRWHDALKACDQLYLLDAPGSLHQRASIYVAKKEFFNARRLLDKLAAQQDLAFLLRMRVQVLLAYCSLAEGNFNSEAVTLLLRVSEDMSDSQMDYELALVDMLLAQVLLLLGLPQKAYQAIKRSMDDIHINGGLYERAKTDFVFVRCLLAITADGEHRKAQLLKSVDILERSAKSFKQLSAHAKVLDVYVFLAQRFNEFGQRALRNKYAGEFRRYFMDHPIPREYLGAP
ncbi:uncharacterized protein LOC6558540 [Drosophila grimshawi]|uniref:Anaphase-promoting complex subunit 5 n=1 Tax=Drosophila grimshawi TaxID=7222 RepID=B4IZ31_DROGR|nr:uncharacterized protein LOC6558540 [Drosophila grimshawi]EDV95553.1 GH15768 [Drosophila grimshawi]